MWTYINFQYVDQTPVLFSNYLHPVIPHRGRHRGKGWVRSGKGERYTQSLLCRGIMTPMRTVGLPDRLSLSLSSNRLWVPITLKGQPIGRYDPRSPPVCETITHPSNFSNLIPP